MKARFRNKHSTLLIGLVLFCFWTGCASLDQKIADSSITQKIKEWQMALKKKMFADDDQSPSPDESHPLKAEKTIATDASGLFVHTVQRRGETLEIIAKWYTGDSKNRQALAAVNPTVNSKRIPMGSQILIPQELLKTREPLSGQFAAEHLPAYFEHTVHWPGETLSLIAKWYTGEYRNWKKLADHNPEINPKHIVIGQQIFIPANLLKTREVLPQKVAAKCLPDYFAYTIKRPGERLAHIAKWYTGDAENSEALVKVNPELDPERLLVGNEIYIPADLLKTRQPISPPAAELSEEKPKNESSSSAPSPAPQKEKEIQLFGPKLFPKS
jgi:hypothetical protein